MLKTIKDDIWCFRENNWIVVVPTNGWVNTNGEAVMGRGIALQARKLFKNLSMTLGKLIKSNGNEVFYFPRQKLVTFPTKHKWKDPSDIDLITKSCKTLKSFMEKDERMKVVMPKVGCGNGKKSWSEIAPIIEKFFGDMTHDRFLIVDNEQGDSETFRGKNTENIRGDVEKTDRPLVINAGDKRTFTEKELLEGKLKHSPEEIAPENPNE